MSVKLSAWASNSKDELGHALSLYARLAFVGGLCGLIISALLAFRPDLTLAATLVALICGIIAVAHTAAPMNVRRVWLRLISYSPADLASRDSLLLRRRERDLLNFAEKLATVALFYGIDARREELLSLLDSIRTISQSGPFDEKSQVEIKARTERLIFVLRDLQIAIQSEDQRRFVTTILETLKESTQKM